MKTYIHVTDKHIDRGIGGDSKSCALALAAEEALPAYEIIFVTWSFIGAKHLLTGKPTPIHNPIPNFITEFDWYKFQRWAKRPLPITFEVEIPDEDIIQDADCAPVIACSKRFDAPEAILSRGVDPSAHMAHTPLLLNQVA